MNFQCLIKPVNGFLRTHYFWQKRGQRQRFEQEVARWLGTKERERHYRRGSPVAGEILPDLWWCGGAVAGWFTGAMAPIWPKMVERSWWLLSAIRWSQRQIVIIVLGVEREKKKVWLNFLATGIRVRFGWFKRK